MARERLKQNLRDSLSIINDYQWLIDAYVLDYYTEDHWNQLPLSWRTAFQDLEDVDQLADLLNERSSQTSSVVLPLSLLALKKCMQKLCASRKVEKEPAKAVPKHMNYLYKQVKQKKVHEIQRMAGLTAETAKRCNTKYVVDFGAGLGHLARNLSFEHGIRVCCLEQQETLSKEAK